MFYWCALPGAKISDAASLRSSKAREYHSGLSSLILLLGNMKKILFEDGDVFAIFLKKDLSAYCRVIGRNSYGPLVELFDQKTKDAVEDIDLLKKMELGRIKFIFINKYSLKNKKKAKFIGNWDLTEKETKHPPIFQGSSKLFWKVFSEDKVEKFSPKDVSYEELMGKGYIDSTIYSTEAIVDYYLSNKPLIFGPDSTLPMRSQLQS